LAKPAVIVTSLRPGQSQQPGWFFLAKIWRGHKGKNHWNLARIALSAKLGIRKEVWCAAEALVCITHFHRLLHPPFNFPVEYIFARLRLSACPQIDNHFFQD